MGNLSGETAYWKFMGQCTQCGKCTASCPSLTKADMTLGNIARRMLELDRNAGSPAELASAIQADPALVQAVRGCFFCTQCKNTCFAHNDVCDLIYHTRTDFQNLGLIPRAAWSSVLVDQEWHIFTAYRAIYGIGYPDLTLHVENEYHAAQTDCEVAFFPGCSMAAYAPELTREIHATIEQLAGKTTLIDHCCGSPLKSAGYFERAEALCATIAAEIGASGASQVVCVCPGCANAMVTALEKAGLSHVRVVSLSEFLTSHGFTSSKPLPAGEIWLSKSCQDRDGSYLQQTCKVLGLDEQAPSIFNGCCGAGGAVSAFDATRQASQASSKLSFAADGSTVITMCPTCTYTYASQLMSAPRPITNKHYAELLFTSQFDWDTVFSQLGSMWYGEYGPWLAQVFA